MLLAKTWQPYKAVTCHSLLGILLQIFGNWIYLKYSKDNVQNTFWEYSQITRRMNVVVVLSCKAYPLVQVQALTTQVFVRKIVS